MVIAKYIRLSLADKDVMKKENKIESESIAHQRDLIQRYIDSHPDLKKCEVREFYDDGYSGTNFKRPSFERLIEEIKKGEIGCVIVKDFSRFGRDYIELGDYMERIFPFLGIRFISVNDRYDSNDFKGTTGGLDVVLKNIVYDFYSKDLSMKVKTAKRANMKRGEYVGGNVPYGLERDKEDKHKLVIDNEVAHVVREIFEYAINGMRIVDIARRLNEKGYETPARYYQRKYPGHKTFKNTSKLSCWNDSSVRRLLQQKMYYGAIVQHKREGIGVGWKHSVAVPKEEQLVIEGRHPGIVTKEEFLAAQRIFKKNAKTKYVREKDYPLWRKVKCGNCGRAMLFRSYKGNDVEYRYFCCPHTASQIGSGGCTKEYFREDELNDVVWQSIKGMVSAMGIAKKRMAKKLSEADSKKSTLIKNLTELQKEKAKCEAERFNNMDQFLEEHIDKELFKKRRLQLTKKIDHLGGMITEVDNQLQEIQKFKDDGRDALNDIADKYTGITELNQKIVDVMIDKVVVYDMTHIEIRWNFSDAEMRLLNG